MARIRSKSSGLLVATIVLVMTAAFLPLGSAGASGSPTPRTPATGVRGKVTHETVARVGKVNVRDLVTRVTAGQTTSPGLASEAGPWRRLERESSARPSAGAQAPSPSNTSVVVNENNRGWEGLDHTDQRFAGGGNQFSLEPPDQGLCVGGVSPNDPSYGPEVVESVNDALVFYDAQMHQLDLPITLSQFFGLPPTINRTTGKFGPFISDPKCYFDPDTQRWFHSVLTIAQDPNTGAFEAPASVYVAVSTSSEALGSYFIYRIDATDASHPNCPCFGDQPLIGADKYGFYVSTAEYDLAPFGGNFNGPQIYAMSKKRLENGTLGSLVHISGITHVAGGRTTGTVQPAMAQVGQFDTSNGGTEYFLSGFDCLPDAACAIAPGTFNQITTWALTNTASLGGSHPNPHLSLQDVQVGSYQTPVPQREQDGPRPLGELDGEPVPLVNANDSRMNQVVYADGYLWSGINTTVLPGPRDGIEYFVVAPSIASGLVQGTIHNQGYVAAANRFLSFPSVGVNGSGRGVIAFTLMGPNDYPSAAQIAISAAGVSGNIQIVRRGFRPEDGFTCYVTEVGPGALCRWGDYSASVGTPGGQVFSATEFVGDNTRTFFANWSTFVWPVNPT
jgi:hypothetical protein